MNVKSGWRDRVEHGEFVLMAQKRPRAKHEQVKKFRHNQRRHADVRIDMFQTELRNTTALFSNYHFEARVTIWIPQENREGIEFE